MENSFFGVSSSCFFKREYTEDALTKMAEQGITDCEVFLSSFCEYEPEFITTLAKRSRETGVKIRSVHALSVQFEPQLFGYSGTRAFQDADRIFRTILDGAQRLGAHIYVFHGSANLKRGVVSDRGIEGMAKSLTYLAEEAKKRCVKLALENVHWCMYDRPGVASKLRGLVESDNLYHTLDLKQAFQSGYPIEDYIDDMGDRLVHVHVCDCVRAENGLSRTAMPFCGEIDFESVRRKLRDTGYDRGYILEVYPKDYEDYGELKHSADRIREFFGG